MKIVIAFMAGILLTWLFFNCLFQVDFASKLKSEEAQSVVDLFEIRLANAHARKKQVVARLEWAERECARAAKLHQKNAISEQDFYDIKLKLEIARSDYEESGVKEIEALVRCARARKALVEAGVWPPVWLEK